MPKKFKFAKPPKKDEDLEPSALILKEGGLCCREETKFYPKLSTKMKGKSRWTDAFEEYKKRINKFFDTENDEMN